MATAFIKSPCEFAFGDDVDLFLDRFSAFVTATKCEAKGRFDLFKSFLDDRSFRRVQTLTFGDVHKTDGSVDLSKKETQEILKKALTKEALVPERVSLRFKVQGKDESIEDFGDSIRLLGQKVHGKGVAETCQNVVEAFCAGLRDPKLASKMLSKVFTSLTEAINFAVSRQETCNIKDVIDRQRAMSRSANDSTEVLPNQEGEVKTSGVATPPLTQCRGSSRRQHGGDSRICFLCHRVGHVQKFCDQLMSSPKLPGQIFCYRCGRAGHISRNCRGPVTVRGSEQNFREEPESREWSRTAWPAR